QRRNSICRFGSNLAIRYLAYLPSVAPYPLRRPRRTSDFLVREMKHVYEVRSRKDKRGVDLISDALPFGRLWYDKSDNAIDYAMHYTRAADAVIRVYDASGNVIETHEHKGDFKEP